MKYKISFDLDFKRNPYKGKYIVLEGIEGSGKTTQAEILYKHFKELGKDVLKTREPRKSAGIIGELIGKVLQGKVKVPAISLQYLLATDRAIHQEEIIIPALKSGTIVISDRSFWSAVPYGLVDKKEGSINHRLVAQSILSMYHQFIIPDHTFYLDVRPSEGLSRVKNKIGEKKEIYEKKGLIEKAKRGYELLLSEFPREFIIINASQPVQKVTDDIIKKIKI